MSLELTGEPSILEAQSGRYLVVSLTAKTQNPGELTAYGKELAENYRIGSPLVQVTPLTHPTVPPRDSLLFKRTPNEPERYLITITRRPQ
jgi:hypothetical protein